MNCHVYDSTFEQVLKGFLNFSEKSAIPSVILNLCNVTTFLVGYSRPRRAVEFRFLDAIGRMLVKTNPAKGLGLERCPICQFGTFS